MRAYGRLMAGWFLEAFGQFELWLPAGHTLLEKHAAIRAYGRAGQRHSISGLPEIQRHLLERPGTPMQRRLAGLRRFADCDHRRRTDSGPRRITARRPDSGIDRTKIAF